MDRRYIFYVFFLCCFISVCGRMSGIYVDNGVDQTSFKKILSKNEKKEVEREILDLLGLQSRPKTMMPSHLSQSAPKFLIDVYKSLLDTDNKFKNKFTANGEQKAIDESDVIMSFSSQKHHVDGLRHDGSRRLWFDVSEVPATDMIVGAELRIYQSPKVMHATSPHHHHPGSGLYSVTAYQVNHNQMGEPELQYVDSLNTTAHNEGWLVFNMTGPISTWVAIPNLNLGLYVSITSQHHPSHEIRPEDVGIVPPWGEKDHRPFMVAFFKSSEVAENKIRQTRDTTRRRKKKSQNNPEDFSSFMQNPLMRHVTSPWTGRSCQMQNLFVSFKDLKWQDWIIAPDGFQAFFCSGQCDFPLNANMNATNHAIVQTLVHLLKPTQVPKPCCAPTKLSAISVLYFLEDSNVILKKYKNMVVKSCGCQ